MSRPPQSREPERSPAQEQTLPPQMREPVPLETIQASVGGTSVTGTQASPAEHAEARFVPNRDFGHYRLLKKLGEGGMGSVWQALHVKLDKHVAVKLLPAAWSRDPALLSRFEREMKAVGKLEHPHIVRAMDAGECEGTHYLVMEFNDGLDLSAYVKQRGPQSVQNACEMVRHAALGLAHAHAAGLIHRDIKPSNLFLTRTGKVKILDLGLARVQGENAGDGQTLTGLGQVLGTPDYMAPEQWENTHAADARSDLYALGCTLFYLLTGRAPFSGEHQMSLVAKMKGHTLDPIPDLQAARREAVANRPKLVNDLVSDDLNALYRRLMSKCPADRFATADELAEALLPFGKSRGTAPVVFSKTSDPQTDATMPLDFFAQLQAEAETKVLPVGGSHATGFTPGGSRASAPRSASDVTVAQKRGNHPGKRGGVMIAAALVAFLVLAGIIIKITKKDGTVTEIEVPDDAKVEIRNRHTSDDKPSGTTSKSPKTTSTKPASGGLSPKAPHTEHEDRFADRADWPVWAKEIKEPPPLEEWLKGRKELTVKQDGSAMFTTIQAALDKVQPGEVIRVLDKGPYRERLIGNRKAFENYGLFSNQNTVVELGDWGINSGAKETPLGHDFGGLKNVRLHGFTFLCIPTEAATSTPLHIFDSPGFCLENCLFLSHTSEPIDSRRQWCHIFFGDKKSPGHSLCVRQCVFDLPLQLGGLEAPASAIVKNNVFHWRHATNLPLGVNLAAASHSVIITHNVFASAQENAMTHPIQLGGPQGEEGDDRLLVTHNTLSHPGDTTVNVIYGSPGREIEISSNLLSTRSLGAGFGAGAETLAPLARQHWKVQNNWGGAGTDHSRWVPLTDPDHRGEVPYLSLDPQDQRNYLRLDPAKLPRDVKKVPGALPPGPAPAEGDWFTHLLDRYHEAVQLRDAAK